MVAARPKEGEVEVRLEGKWDENVAPITLKATLVAEEVREYLSPEERREMVEELQRRWGKPVLPYHQVFRFKQALGLN